MTSRNPRKKNQNDFFSQVYELTRQIPHGRITTYGAIARYLGTGLSARTVGWALNNCHTEPDFVPAHRVVNRNGQLSGKMHFGTPTAMEQLLRNEGVEVEDDAVIDFDKRFWDPAKDLKRRK